MTATLTRPFDLSLAKAYRWGAGDLVWLDHVQLNLDTDLEIDDDEIEDDCTCPSCGYWRDEDNDEDQDDDEPVVTLATFIWGGTARTEHASALLMQTGLGTELSVWSVKVDEGFRGQGYGRQLMQHICRMADWHNYSLHLQVYTNNTPAIRLYESMGFVTTDEGNDRYFVMRRPDRQLTFA